MELIEEVLLELVEEQELLELDELELLLLLLLLLDDEEPLEHDELLEEGPMSSINSKVPAVAHPSAYA